jgi:hypothetical protein
MKNKIKKSKQQHIIVPADELAMIEESVNETTLCWESPEYTRGFRGPKFEPEIVNSPPPSVGTPMTGRMEVMTGLK